MNSTLLTDYFGCVGAGCSSDLSSTSGEISLEPDEKAIVTGTSDATDLVEVSGSCQDLNIRNNRILVQVFDTSSTGSVPYIDNSKDVYCSSVSNTKEYRPATSGTITTYQQCFFVSNGVGLVEGTQLYPQCFNGRFAFKVRVGRVVRKDPFIADFSETNPIIPYIVRMKIRAIGQTLTESNWVSVPISRFIPAPVIESKASTTNMRIDINIMPAKQRDIRYTMKYTWTGPSYVAGTPSGFTNSGSGTVLGFVDKKPDFPIKTDGTSVDNFWIDSPDGNNKLYPFSGVSGVMPGLTYTFDISGSDFQYDYLTYPGPGAIDRGTSTTVTVVMPPAWVTRTDQDYQGVKNTCLISLNGANNRGGYSVEWRYSTAVNWMKTSPSSGTLYSSCTSPSMCYVNLTAGGFSVGNVYYFAARSFIDLNGNGRWDPGEVVGEWSPHVTNGANVPAYGCEYKP